MTTNVVTLTQFSESVSQLRTETVYAGYVHFQSQACDGLEVIEPALIPAFGERAAKAGVNRSVIFDGEVYDVDAEFERCQETVDDWVMAPKITPRGAVASIFRGTDQYLGNMCPRS